MPRFPARAFPLVVLPLALAGCGGNENTLAAKSPPQHAISHLWFWTAAGSAIGFTVVCALLLLGWFRRDREGLPFGGGDRAGTALVVGLGIVVPVILLILLFVWSDTVVLRSTAAPSAKSTQMTVRVIGHQWWWEVRYDGSKAVTANEIHIPVGVRVDVVGTTADVIHSFWIPQLNRKIDLIPGRSNRVLLEADEPGVYRGECAEFCGLQHAHMTATVVAQAARRVPRLACEHGEAGTRSRGRTGRARPDGLPRRRVRGLPPVARDAGARRRGARPDAPRDAHDARRRDDPERHGAPRGLDRDPQHYKPGNRMPALDLYRQRLRRDSRVPGDLK